VNLVTFVLAEIAGNVTRKLQPVVRDVQGRSRAELTGNFEGDDFYLRGNQYFNRDWQREDIKIAPGMYQRAVELDSAFAAARAVLSRAEGMMFSFDRLHCGAYRTAACTRRIAYGNEFPVAPPVVDHRRRVCGGGIGWRLGISGGLFVLES
jgi:hypothetical protein